MLVRSCSSPRLEETAEYPVRYPDKPTDGSIKDRRRAFLIRHDDAFNPPATRASAAKGPISAALIDRRGDRAPHNHLEPVWIPLRDSDPLGLDVQLALYLCYELHYRGFAGVDPDWEWNAGLLHLRAQFERIFLAAVRHEVGRIDPETPPTGRWRVCR